MAEPTPPPAYAPLKEYVEAPSSDDTFVERCWNRAVKMVRKECKDNGLTVGEDGSIAGVDDEVIEGAIVDVGSELYHRRNAPFGVTTMAAGSDGPVAARVSVDPLVRARVMLAPYFRGGFA